MINVGQEQTLGKRSQILIVSRRTTVAFVLIVVCLFLLMINVPLATGIAHLLSLGGSINHSTIVSISNSLSTFTFGVFLLAIIAGLLGIIVGILQYRNFAFTMDELSLKIRHGFINRHEALLPYRQIDDIRIERPLMYRAFGVSRLVLVAAGDVILGTKHPDENDTVFDPIDAELAEEIRSFLERHVGVQIIQDKSQVVLEEKADEKIEQKIESDAAAQLQNK